MPTHPFRTWHYLVLTSTVLLTAYQSITKGWFVFFTLPLLVILLPIYITTQVIADKQIVKGIARHWVFPLMLGQMVSFLLSYLCLPGMGDTEEVWMFGAVTMHSDDALVMLSALVSIVSMLVFLASTILLFVFLSRRKTTQTSVE